MRLVIVVAVALALAFPALQGRLSREGLDSLLGRGDGKPVSGRVTAVVDGDTLRVRTGGREERVRLVGIDTPESVKPDAPVECGAKGAAAALRRLALTRSGRGRRVRLVRDRTQDRRDRYGRLLAYVETPGGRDLGRAQVRAGWAELFVFAGDPFARLASYRSAYRAARDERRGVHGACAGDFHRR